MSDRRFSGGEVLVPNSMEHRTYVIMMKSELRNGMGAYEIGNAGAAASAPSFGPFQYDVGANQDGRALLESIATSAKDAHNHRIISSHELDSIQSHLYKPFNSFTDADRAVYTQMKPKLDAALRSDAGVQAINADFVTGVQKKVAAMNSVVEGMVTEPNKTFVQNNDVAKLILIDTRNQYGRSVNAGLKKFVDRTQHDPAMDMPGRASGAAIRVDGAFGLDDMIRYKLETQYGQSDQGAKDVLRRISHCVEAAGAKNVKAGLSDEDKKFFETGLEKYLKDCGRDTTILEDPQLKALAELGGREQHQARSHATHSHQAHPPHNQVRENPTLRVGENGIAVHDLQTKLERLGYTGPSGESLTNRDHHFGPMTDAAVRSFQRENHLSDHGIVGPATHKAIDARLLEVAQTSRKATPDFADTAHPGNTMYLQSLDAVHRLDVQQGRTPDQRSENLAGMLTVAANNQGMSRVDHVVLSDDASRAFAVQGEMNSLFKSIADVNVSQAVATPLAQSSAQWQPNSPQVAAAMPAVPRIQNLQTEQSMLRQ